MADKFAGGINKLNMGGVERKGKAVAYTSTPQTEFIKGRESEQIRNNAGGVSWKLDEFKSLRRFLILGTEGTFYQNEREVSAAMADVILAALKINGPAVVSLIEEVNTAVYTADVQIPAAAPRKSPSLFALAVAKLHGSQLTRESVHDVLRRRVVVSTLSQLFEFLNYLYVLKSSGVGKLDGAIPTGSGFKKALQDWFAMGDRKLVYQFTKYRKRSFTIGKKEQPVERGSYGRSIYSYNSTKNKKPTSVQHSISLRDVLRLIHLKPASQEQNLIVKWGAGEVSHQEAFTALTNDPLYKAGRNEALDYLAAFLNVQNNNNPNTVVSHIAKYGLTWEMLPNFWHSDSTPREHRLAIWKALIGLPVNGHTPEHKMPLNALIRNLPRFAAYGLLDDPQIREYLSSIFVNQQVLLKARVHPISFLQAYRIHLKGTTGHENLKWTPDRRFAADIEAGFYASFGAIQPHNKKVFYALDVSGSMTQGEVLGIADLTPIEAEAVMLMALIRSEPRSNIAWKGFTSGREGMVNIPITQDMTLEQVVDKFNQVPFGGTDCSLPFQYALRDKAFYDAFVIQTDGESWAGHPHPSQALGQYRAKINPNAKVAMVAYTSTEGTINDPSDRQALDVVGFDAAMPQVLNQFIQGNI